MNGAGTSDGRLTVVLPNRNHAAFLSQAICSVLDQTRPPDRLVIIDDCSTDDSRDVIATFANKSPTIEIIHNEQRQGVIANIKNGLANAKTEFVAFQAADDFIEPSLYETALNALNAAPDCAIAAPSCQWVDETGTAMAQPADPPIADEPTHLSPDDVFNNLKKYGPFVSGNGSIYRTAHLQIVGFDETLGAFCDGFAQQQLFASGGLCYIPQRLAAWRKLDAGFAISSARDAASSATLIDTLAKKLNSPAAQSIPRDYAAVLLNRMRFDAVRSAIGTKEGNEMTLEKIVPSASSRLAISATKNLAGRRIAVLAAMIMLRPGDVWFALRRRLFKGAHA